MPSSNKNSLIIVILFIIILLVAGGLYFTKGNRPSTNFYRTGFVQTATSTDGRPTPMAECVECVGGKTWNGKSCCASNFVKICLAQNGAAEYVNIAIDSTPTVHRRCFALPVDFYKNQI